MASTLHTTGRATTHARIVHSPADLSRQRVMRGAHARARRDRIAFPEALRQAWAIEKGLTAEGAQPRDAALRAAVEVPPARPLPPDRRARSSRPSVRVRCQLPPRAQVKQSVAEVFSAAYRVHDGWHGAGRPRITKHERDALSIAVHVLIETLDAVDGDPDREPSLGAPERSGLEIQFGPGAVPYAWADKRTGQDPWADGARDDREEEDEHGGDILEEPHDGEDGEPDLGSLGGTAEGCEMAQDQWGEGTCMDMEATEDGDDLGTPSGGVPLWNDPKIAEAREAARVLARRTSPSPDGSTILVLGPDAQRYFASL